MTREDTIKILSVLRGAYPAFYRDITKQEAESTIALWESMFDEPYELVAAAVKAFISTDGKGFPPAIGQIKDRIRLITEPAQMTEGEAWSLVLKALRNSSYNSAEEYAKLPENIQRLVGSHNQLREWAMMDTESLQTVVGSNFQRSYRARAKADAEYDKLPGEVKELAKKIAGQVFGRLDPVPARVLEDNYENCD